MRIAISQPTYLPWSGYFALLDQVDHFVLLDTVQFSKRSWQQRNRIKGRTGLEWMTIPVRVAGRYHQPLNEVEIEDPRFVQRHLRRLTEAYRDAPFFESQFPGVAAMLTTGSPHARLTDVTIPAIRRLAEVIGIHTPITAASTLGVAGRRSELLVEICLALGATEYVSAAGARAYLCADLELFSRHGISVWFQHYVHPVYAQRHPPFAPFASVVDLLFNEGPNTLSILAAATREPDVAEPTSQALAVSSGLSRQTGGI